MLYNLVNISKIKKANINTYFNNEGNLIPFDYPSFIIITNVDGDFYLTRYNIKGESVGDTHHETVEEAKQQAMYEYDDAIQSVWNTIPEEIEDKVKFVYELVNKK